MHCCISFVKDRMRLWTNQPTRMPNNNIIIIAFNAICKLRIGIFSVLHIIVPNQSKS